MPWMLLQLLTNLTVFTSLFFSACSPAFAAPNPKGSSKSTEAKQQQKEIQHEVSLSDILSLYTVKIFNVNSPIFTLQPEQSHGSGFVGDITKNDDGVEVYRIFTNKHVTAMRSPSFAQNLAVSFHSQNSAIVKFKAKLVLVDSLHDFAVLEVPVADVQKHNIQVALAPLPRSQHKKSKNNPYATELNQLEKRIREAKTFYEGIKMQDSFAVGNPFEGENVMTKGIITAFGMDPESGPHIYTDTSINPGNSGGPLFILEDEAFPLVVGINTAIKKGANNFGYTIPIGVVMRIYDLWKESHNRGYIKYFTKLNFYTKDAAEYLGYADQIRKVMPKYFDNIHYILQATHAHPNSQIKNNDIILSANGTMVGTIYQFVYELCQINIHKQKTMDVEVLRNGKIVKLKMDLQDQSLRLAKYSMDVVYVSGHVFQRAPTDILTNVPADIKSRVTVMDVVENPEMQFAESLAVIPGGSLIKSVVIDSVEYPIVNLKDLKQALRNTTEDSQILVHYHLAMAEEDEETGAFKVHHTLTTRTAKIPAREILTGRDIPLRKIRQEMELSMGGRSASRDWRTYVTKRSSLALRDTCDKALK